MTSAPTVKCNLLQIAAVATCDIAPLLPAEDKGEERDSSVHHSFPHQKHIKALSATPETSVYQLPTVNMTLHKETISI